MQNRQQTTNSKHILIAKEKRTPYNKHMILLLPILLYSIIFLPYLHIIPGNDGNVEFYESYKWFLGTHITNHVPFKLILFSFFFKFFGYHSTGYVGLIFGCIGIVALYSIAKKLFDEKVALISSLLLATSGLYIAVGALSIRDFLITVFILVAFAFYVHKRNLLYAFFLCLAIFTKETAVFFAVSIVIAELFTKRKTTLTILAPIIIFLTYLKFVYASGNHVWNDYNFSATANKGSIYTMANNIVTLKLFNKYAYENWLHLFVFNFNWLYWIFALISLRFIRFSKMKDTILPIGIFFLIFIVTVLSFQTFTITRYILPLIPFVYLFAAAGVTKLPGKLVFITLILLVSAISLARSVDPVSNIIWHKTTVLGEQFYLNRSLDGPDGITYNLQYLTMMQERTTMILQGNCNFPQIITFGNYTKIILHITSCHNLVK